MAALVPDQVPAALATVTGASPLLVPAAVPAGWTARVSVASTSFTVTYSAPSAAESVTLSISIPNPPWSADETSSSPSFRGAEHSTYLVYNEPGRRVLLWIEPGVWSGQSIGGVPYDLTSDGLTDTEFWRIANSLRVVGPNHPVDARQPADGSAPVSGTCDAPSGGVARIVVGPDVDATPPCVIVEHADVLTVTSGVPIAVKLILDMSQATLLEPGGTFTFSGLDAYLAPGVHELSVAPSDGSAATSVQIWVDPVCQRGGPRCVTP